MVLSIFLAILIAGISATTLMTLFSQLVSKYRGIEFNEADLLAKFINRTKYFPIAPKLNLILGWSIHYLIGIVLAACMYFIYCYFNMNITILNGGLIGLIAGFIGAMGWIGLFAFHWNPPHTELKEFILQLLIAHCIFGCTAAIIFKTFL